ncbi:hypothetical protein [Cognataquiflexum rubidum]|uniref:hypothetical protein n=1 Tax=Cognataquiflexum rubidum TaxID=2922273 RepID=UPI001F13FC6B|nr:hypothetical protein [Cognataquiflexum rubidum]MCH6235359.1 hypothetical protein [Cognataquiflexum rubidum]
MYSAGLRSGSVSPRSAILYLTGLAKVEGLSSAPILIIGLTWTNKFPSKSSLMANDPCTWIWEDFLFFEAILCFSSALVSFTKIENLLILSFSISIKSL